MHVICRSEPQLRAGVISDRAAAGWPALYLWRFVSGGKMFSSGSWRPSPPLVRSEAHPPIPAALLPLPAAALNWRLTFSAQPSGALHVRSSDPERVALSSSHCLPPLRAPAFPRLTSVLHPFALPPPLSSSPSSGAMGLGVQRSALGGGEGDEDCSAKRWEDHDDFFP